MTFCDKQPKVKARSIELKNRNFSQKRESSTKNRNFAQKYSRHISLQLLLIQCRLCANCFGSIICNIHVGKSTKNCYIAYSPTIIYLLPQFCSCDVDCNTAKSIKFALHDEMGKIQSTENFNAIKSPPRVGFLKTKFFKLSEYVLRGHK